MRAAKIRYPNGRVSWTMVGDDGEPVEACFGPDYPIHQVALAGRAAKRMADASGREAVTVYRFLRDVAAKRRACDRGLLIVDEASMIVSPRASTS